VSQGTRGVSESEESADHKKQKKVGFGWHIRAQEDAFESNQVRSIYCIFAPIELYKNFTAQKWDKDQFLLLRIIR